MQNSKLKVRMPAEWEIQSFIQLTYPYAETDWAYMLDEVLSCFDSIARKLAKHQNLLVVCAEEQQTRERLKNCLKKYVCSNRVTCLGA